VSLEILLIPVALAAHAAWQARAERDQHAAVVQTRLKDPGMLRQAIANLGGQASLGADGVRGQLDGATLHFAVNADGLAVARIAGMNSQEAEDLIRRIDGDYAAQVQTRMYDQLMSRAAALGLTVENEEVDEDNTITVTLLTGQATT
jgi:hypothetical protein